MARLKRLEVWTTVACDSGTRVAVIPRSSIVTADESLEINGEEQLLLTLDPLADVLAELQHDRVIRVLYDDDNWDEYRIRTIRRTRDQAGGTGYDVTAKSIKFDLQTKAPLVEFGQADGSSYLHHEMAAITPEDFIDALVTLTDWPAYFVKGTIEPTEKRDFVLEWETYLSALTELATVTDAELVVTRNGITDYQIHLLTAQNSTAEKPLVTLKRNVLSSDVLEDSTELCTWVYPRGEGQQGEAAAVGKARWRWGAGFNSGTNTGELILEFADASAGFGVWPPAIIEEDQLNGLYVRWFDWVTAEWYVWEITDSTFYGTHSYIMTVTVDRGTDPVPTGNAVAWLGRDPFGSALNYIPLPSAVATYGIRPYILERDDIPGVNNMLNDPFMEWGYTWPNYAAIGGAVLSNIDAPSPYVHYGNRSIKVVCATAGDGLERDAGADIFSFGPNPQYPNISWQTYVFVESGRIKFELVHDVTNPPGPEPPYTATYPYGLDEDGNEIILKTEAVPAWYHLAIEPALVNFWLTDGQYGESPAVDVRWIALDDDTTFYVDAVQAVPDIVSAPKIVRGSSYGQLWGAGQAALQSDITQPKIVLDIDVLDLNRLDGATYPYDEIDLGVTLTVRDPAVGQDIERRVAGVRRNLMQEALTQIELEQE